MCQLKNIWQKRLKYVQKTSLNQDYEVLLISLQPKLVKVQVQQLVHFVH